MPDLKTQVQDVSNEQEKSKNDRGKDKNKIKLLLQKEQTKDKEEKNAFVAQFEEVFSLGYIPLDRFYKRIEEETEGNKEIKTIDFSKEGYITDAIIRTLFTTTKKPFSYVTCVNLEGCSAVTDIGLHWLAKGFSENNQIITVNINGCTKISDGGLATLLNMSNVDIDSAIATSVVHLGDCCNTKGCPVLNPRSSNRLNRQIEKESFLMIVSLATKHSILEFINSKAIKKRQPFQHLRGHAIEDWKINITEMEREHRLFHQMLPKNPVHVMITFDSSSDVEFIKKQMLETIEHVLSKESVNPEHRFIGGNLWNICEVSFDENLKNITHYGETTKAIVACQPFCRKNNYIELKCKQSATCVFGAMRESFLMHRFPMEDYDDDSDGCIESYEIKKEKIYQFGIDGPWLSEFVPCEDVKFFLKENGKELFLEQKPHAGMYPFISVFLEEDEQCTCLTNKACPPMELTEEWNNKKEFWTPAFKHNILCDDMGIASFQGYSLNGKGLLIFQEPITGEHNTFAMEIIDTGNSDVITIGLGPENYDIDEDIGSCDGSIGYNGKNGMLYIQTWEAENPSKGEPYLWRNGDEIKAVVKGLEKYETIQPGKEVKVNFFVNEKLIKSVHTKISDDVENYRFVFMVGLEHKGNEENDAQEKKDAKEEKNAKFKIMNYRRVYTPAPETMDFISYGKSHLINVMDSGLLEYSNSDGHNNNGLFISKTPFSKALTYFEIKIEKLSDERNGIVVGISHKDYPLDKQLGLLPGSIGYNGSNTNLINPSSEASSFHNETEFKEGDIVGCGFDPKKAKFREDGSLENQQRITFSFSFNKKMVYTVDFEYLTDGLFPALNLSKTGDRIIIQNFKSLTSTNSKKVEETKNKFTEGCRFTIVGVNDGITNIEDKVNDLREEMRLKNFPAISKLDKQIRSMENNLKLMNFQAQESYAQLCWQKECLERFSKSRVKFITVNFSSQDHEKLEKRIKNICEKDLQYHRLYYSHDDSVRSGLKNFTEELSTEKIMLLENIKPHFRKPLKDNARAFEAAVRYMQSKGCLFLILTENSSYTIDIEFLEELMKWSLNPPQTLSGNSTPIIGKHTKIWNVTDIESMAKDLPKTKVEILKDVLVHMGIIQIPCFYDEKVQLKYCYCSTNEIGLLPVKLAHFKNDDGKDCICMKRDYSFLYNSPLNIFPNIVSRCLLFSRALAISSDWSVFQSGATQTIIYINKDHEQVLSIETRCFMPTFESSIDEDTKFNVEEYTFNIFCLFTDIVDMLIGVLNTSVITTDVESRNFVNRSIGCIHNWGLSSEPYRQTACTLCGMCCDKGPECPYNRISGYYQHQCACNTSVIGCKDCGICQKCANLFWTIRSYLRPNLEVASHEDMKSSICVPLTSTTYDEVEFTNLGEVEAPLCLERFNRHKNIKPIITRIFPPERYEYYVIKPKRFKFKQGDTVKIKMDSIKRDENDTKEEEEPSVLGSTDYSTSICRECSIWHETGVVAYTGTSSDIPVGQFISSLPLSKQCPSFSFEIVSCGQDNRIGIGICNKGYPRNAMPGWWPGSFAYHADDGGIFKEYGAFQEEIEICEKGDIMICKLNFETKNVTFSRVKKDGFGKDRRAEKSIQLDNFGDFYAAVGLHSMGAAVRLLEKAPWQSSSEDVEQTIPSAFEIHKYGNLHIIPSKILSVTKIGMERHAWLMFFNPSKNVVAYKISDLNFEDSIGYVKASDWKIFWINKKYFYENPLRPESVEISWCLLESDRDHEEIDIQSLLNENESVLLTHRLKVEFFESQSMDSRQLKLEEDAKDAKAGYIAEVFKNGISVEKYWLSTGNYICCLPDKCNVLVRYPKLPTMEQPNGFQKGMRIILKIQDQSDWYAEALIEKVNAEDSLELQYSPPDHKTNQCVKTQLNDPNINLEIIQNAINLTNFKPTGRNKRTVTKRTYEFPPFHLLTDDTKKVIVALDSAWKTNTLNSIALCRNVPTRLTVQELQISEMVGSDTTWLAAINPSKESKIAIAFLPAKLGYTNLSYPRIPNMFTEVDAHVLCFLVDQMSLKFNLEKKYNICLDVPLHFTNTPPITHFPPVSANEMFATSFNCWIYSTLFSNKMNLTTYDNMFAEGKPSLPTNELEYLMTSLLHIYAAQCHIFCEQNGGVRYQQTQRNETLVSKMPRGLLKTRNKSNKLIGEQLIEIKQNGGVCCQAHQWCLPGVNSQLESSFKINIELFKDYERSINLLWQKGLTIIKFPIDLYSQLTNLQYLKLQDCKDLKEIPNGISRCLRLEMFHLEECGTERLPKDLFQIVTLKHLFCNSLKVKILSIELPSEKLVNKITNLTLSSLRLTHLPKEVEFLTCLEYLNLNYNPLKSLPEEIGALKKLKTLLLCGIPWIVKPGSEKEIYITQMEEFEKVNSSLVHYIGKEKMKKMLSNGDKNKNNRLDENEIAALNKKLFLDIPRMGQDSTNTTSTDFGVLPHAIFQLTGLETLHLDYQAITAIPNTIIELKNLKNLSISNNPLLENVHGALGHLPSLTSLNLTSNPSLRTPPHEVVSRGLESVKAYLNRLAVRSINCWRTKLMLVGIGGAGKSSLLKALMGSSSTTTNNKANQKKEEKKYEITDGIHIQTWIEKTSDKEIEFNTWDFAGQELYYNTHQFFFSKRAVYLLVWSLRHGFENSGLEFWLSSIACYAPSAPIIIVATHLDHVSIYEIPKSDLKSRYPQIAGFKFVSSAKKEMKGIDELKTDLLRVTLEQKNMGELVPEAWVDLEKKILAQRQMGNDVLPFERIVEFRNEINMYALTDIREALQFLHEIGTVQYFDSLRENVVINPQWIVNVMTCVVSVKKSKIKDNNGVFKHTFLKDIWRDYPEGLHQWLLKVTEEFDLTYRMPREEANIVPCLLPNTHPKEEMKTFLKLSKKEKETKLLYQFSYLPFGLFNRAQVRLLQWSDDKIIWKRGFLLKKNKHQILITQTRDSELRVIVKGPSPQNVIFFIHEIFESLIQETFHGVVYEFSVPCPDCVFKEKTKEPAMFKSSTIKQARIEGIPFLQCEKFFHNVSITQLVGNIPSDDMSDIDIHLTNSITALKKLNFDVSFDVAIIFQKTDQSSGDIIAPERINSDLQAAKLSCWFSEKIDVLPDEEVKVALRNSKVIVALVSNAIKVDTKAYKYIQYAKEIHNKEILIIALGDDSEWKKTGQGSSVLGNKIKIIIRDENAYTKNKIKEMVTKVETMVKEQNKRKEHYQVFLSYCWSNSKNAVKHGTKIIEGALGEEDPRAVKIYLERNQISCFLDKDHNFRKGLVEELSHVMLETKVLVAFVSDEYMKSENCMMEFRQGIEELKLPTIFVEVGTGKEWIKGEVGMWMRKTKSEMIKMQKKKDASLDRLVTSIRKKLKDIEDRAKTKGIESSHGIPQQEPMKDERSIDMVTTTTSIQEEYALMQRKFMRHIINYACSRESVPIPRLLVIDFDEKAWSKNTEDNLYNKESSKQGHEQENCLTNDEHDEESWEKRDFCWKLLCENEEGWHLCEHSFKVEMDSKLKKQIKKCSSYFARLFAILSQGEVRLNCFKSDNFTDWIKNSMLENINFVDSYIELRYQLLEEKDAEDFLNQLHRCLLPTGRIHWLCNEHKSKPGIKSTSRRDVLRVINDGDIKLRDKLEEENRKKGAQQKNKKESAKGKKGEHLETPAEVIQKFSDKKLQRTATSINSPSTQQDDVTTKNGVTEFLPECLQGLQLKLTMNHSEVQSTSNVEEDLEDIRSPIYSSKSQNTNEEKALNSKTNTNLETKDDEDVCYESSEDDTTANEENGQILSVNLSEASSTSPDVEAANDIHTEVYSSRSQNTNFNKVSRTCSLF